MFFHPWQEEVQQRLQMVAGQALDSFWAVG